MTYAGLWTDMLYVGYEPAGSTCSGKPQPGALAFMSWYLGAYGARGATNLGIYGCRTIAGSSVMSLHGEGRAADAGIPVGAPWGQGFADFLVRQSLELQIQCVIYRRRIWSGSYPYQGWRPYNGDSPHEEHAHVEFSWVGATSLNVAYINRVVLQSTGEYMYFVIREPGPRQHMAGRYGGGTWQAANDMEELTRWKTLTPGPEVVITHAQLAEGDIGVNVVRPDQPTAPAFDHVHQVIFGQTGGPVMPPA